MPRQPWGFGAVNPGSRSQPRPDLSSISLRYVTRTNSHRPSSRPIQHRRRNHLQGTDQDQNASGNPEAGTAADGAIPESTQENMGDGAGIRGEYGNASQTNGMEGGPDSPETDTELTGS
jgi:hypothetical protein